MPCNHKFQQYLNLELVDFEPTTLIIGTFNPEWPAPNAEGQEGNNAGWFYGRTDNDGRADNNFWEVLPRLYGEPNLRNSPPGDWKTFCHNKLIAITDLICSIDDARQADPNHFRILGGYADHEIATNFYDFDLVNIVRLLRNSPTITNVYVTRSISEAFWRNKVHSIKTYCDAHEINFVSLLTPSGYAYFQQGKYNRQHPNAQLSLEDYILMRWQAVWHPI